MIKIRNFWIKLYIIQYPKNELSVSYSVLDKIYDDEKHNFIQLKMVHQAHLY